MAEPSLADHLIAVVSTIVPLFWNGFLVTLLRPAWRFGRHGWDQVPKDGAIGGLIERPRPQGELDHAAFVIGSVLAVPLGLIAYWALVFVYLSVDVASIFAGVGSFYQMEHLYFIVGFCAMFVIYLQERLAWSVQQSRWYRGWC